jgi:hypothetical protein
MNVQPTLSSRPQMGCETEAILDSLLLATDACFDCAHACRACADACLGEERLVELRSCAQSPLRRAFVILAAAGIEKSNKETDVFRLLKANGPRLR